MKIAFFDTKPYDRPAFDRRGDVEDCKDGKSF